MKVLLVHAHPDPDSFGAAVRDAARRGLVAAGHEVDLVDLEAQDYAPCLTASELDGYDANGAAHPDPVVAEHIRLLQAAEAIVVTYPTFWSGTPAVLQGWIERTMLPGVAFSVRPGGMLRGELRQLRHVIGVTTYGSPQAYRLAVGDPGRRSIRAIRRNAGLRCRFRWLSLDQLDGRPDADRKRFLGDVEQAMAGLA